MKCINCGAEFRNDIEYCMRCGTYLKTGVTISSNDQSISTIRIDNESLVKTYIGNSYHKFIYNNFSLLYFLYGPLYGFSRKMYSYSLVNILLLLIVVLGRSYVKEYVFVGIIIMVMLVFSVSFNNFYIRKVRKKVDKLVLKNSNLDAVRLQSICRKNGGLNLFFTIINIVITIGVLGIAVICILDLYKVTNILETNYLVELYNLIKNKLIEWF